MSREQVGHREIQAFAVEKVNLPKDKANEYRAQARRLREKLDGYLDEHPDFTLKKMLLSGSLAKGTACARSTISMSPATSAAPTRRADCGAAGISGRAAAQGIPELQPGSGAAADLQRDGVVPRTGLDVDVVPILYNGDPQWYGNLVSQDDGSFLRPASPFISNFTRKRKSAQEKHFAQVVRLAKFWARSMKRENEDFRFKSFMIEMILSHLCDRGLDFSDYPEALQHFFTYVARNNIREQIVFTDYYAACRGRTFTEPVKIIDPVNAENNVSSFTPLRRRTRSWMPRSTPAMRSTPRSRPRPSRRPSITGRRFRSSFQV